MKNRKTSAKINDTIRNLLLSVLALAAVSLLAHSVSSGAATPASTAPGRHYYLTKANFNGNQTLKACASGYHFASFTEILEPTVLTYNQSLGRSAADDGAGPPSVAFGWVRTGYPSNSSTTDGAGVPTNCNAWTSGATIDDGEVGAFIPPFENVNNGQPYFAPPFVVANNAACDNSQGYNLGVWCVQN
jgi:hypothetical protein